MKSMKCVDPSTKHEWRPFAYPDTLFTFKAFTGVHPVNDVDLLFPLAVNTCVLSVTNITLVMPREEDDESDEENWVYFDKFIPADHPEVLLNDVLDHVIGTALFGRIWDISHLSAVEVGE